MSIICIMLAMALGGWLGYHHGIETANIRARYEEFRRSIKS